MHRQEGPLVQVWDVRPAREGERRYLVTEGVEPVRALDRELPIIRDPEESWYVRQERDGMIIGPYERDGRTWSIDQVPPAFGMELLPPDLERRKLEALVDAIGDWRICGDFGEGVLRHRG